ncbi:MAG: VWA domain-containing protein [Endozoicomonadaceae bacterium]|nr:VWA domain-containing protein [Endozoicomonadaceae bacterium]
MFELYWPWIWLLLPLPLLVYRFSPPSERQQATLQIPFFQTIDQSLPDQSIVDFNSNLWHKSCLILIWLSLLLAASQPRWVGDPVSLPVTGRDVMMAIDLSGSMESHDLKLKNEPVTRLDVTKNVVSDFIMQRKGDRLGLILFGTTAYLQAPLTFDLNTVQTLLNEATIGIAGERTAIGDAIGLAVRHLRKRPEEQRILILLTDGANTAGEVSPEQAAVLAREEKVRIYSIGVGAEEMIQPGFFGSSFGAQRINPSVDLDETMLTLIADQTGGRYFRAKDTEELKQIYDLLNQIEPVEQSKDIFRPVQPLYYWPLAMASLCSLALALSLSWLPLAGGKTEWTH